MRIQQRYREAVNPPFHPNHQIRDVGHRVGNRQFGHCFPGGAALLPPAVAWVGVEVNENVPSPFWDHEPVLQGSTRRFEAPAETRPR